MRETRPARPRRRAGTARRAWAVLLALALALGQALGVAGRAGAAAASQGTMTVTRVTDIQDWPDINAPFRNFHSFEASGAGVVEATAYCGDKTMATPGAGTTFSGGYALGSPLVDYILYHGYSSTRTEGYGCTPGKFYVATQYALWLALPDKAGSHAEVHDELTRTYAAVRDAVSQMLSEAQAYADAGGGGPEAGCAVYWPSPDGVQQGMVTKTNPTGTLELAKTSARPALSDGNDLYDLAGAVYGVYSSPECDAASEVVRLTTDATGRAVAAGLPVGTYHVREITPASGFALDSQTHEVRVESASTTRLDVSDAPQADPVTVVVAKVDAETSAGTAQGDATLAGAEFTVRYYAGSYGSADELPGQATRTWVVATGADGTASLDANHLVSGDALYTNSAGDVVLPLGTVTVQETRAPRGYLVTDTSLHLQRVTSSGTLETVEAFVAPAVADEVVRGGVSVPKIDHELEEGVAQGDATLAGAVISIVNASAAPVLVNGTEHAPGEEVMTIVTGADGTASTGADALPYGTYRLGEKSAPKGYRLNATWSVTVSVQQDGQVVQAQTLADEVVRGAAQVAKADADLGESSAQGDATLSGAEISIYNRSESAVLVNGVLYQPGDVVARIVTDASGQAATEPRALPFGTYQARETASPAGYLVNEGWSQTFQVREDGQVVRLEGLSNAVARGGVVVRKADLDWGASSPQGDATLAGAELTIYNQSAAAVVVGGHTYQVGEAVATVATDESGEARSAAGALPFGTYEIRETAAPEGYLVNEGWSRTFEIRSHGQVADLTSETDAVADDVIRGGAELRKVDRELLGAGAEDASLPLGAATLAGARIEIANASEHAVVVDDATFEPGEVVLTLVTDERGSCATEADALPFGTYAARETAAPEGYLVNDGWSQTFQIREDGAVTDLTADKDAVDDQVVRGDLSFTKAEEGTQRRMANVAFRLTSQTTGEWHLLVSDENGMVDTSASWNGRESGVNESDAALCEDGTVDETLLRAASGIWFSGRTDAQTSPADNLGALPYDTYLLEELPCAANEGHRLVSTLVTISRDGVNLDLGTLDDETLPEPEPPAVATTLLSDATADHDAPSYANSTVTDTVNLTNLSVGESYEVRGTLRTVERGEDGEKVVGQVLDTGQTTFVADETSMEVQISFDLDADALAGKTVNAAEELLCGGEVVASHDDLSDEGQSVHLPSVTTSAHDDETGSRASAETGARTLVDTVRLENLLVGETYVLRSSAHARNVAEDGSTSDGGVLPSPGDGEATAEREFVANAQNMEVTVEIDYDASALEGRDVVAFEELRRSGVLLAVHADVDDAEQTLRVPSVETQATADATGTRELPSEAGQVVTDLVHVANLVEGETYELTATLHLKGRDEGGRVVDLGELTDAAGEPLTATTTFVAQAGEADVELSLPVDAEALAGEEVVFFERLSSRGVTLALHADINDADQTLAVPAPDEPAAPEEPATPTGGVPATGEAAGIAASVALAGLAVAGVGALLAARRR